MTKVRVQDATKELSTNAGKMLENVSRLRKQSQDVLGSLRKISADFVREDKERQEREAKEELRKQYEASAQFMTAYSSEQVPEVPAAEVAVKPAPEVEKPAEPAAAPMEESKPAAETAKPAAPAEQAEKKPVAQQPAARPAAAQPGQRPYGRPVQPGQGAAQPGQRP